MGKIYSLNQLKTLIKANPSKWRPLVLTNGCFDLLHVGHLQYLTMAKKMGNSLIVGVNSDRSVQSIKPQEKSLISRPIIPEEQRAEVLTYLEAVDGVIIFPEASASNLVEVLQPDIYVKGGDYTLDTLPETPFVKAYGGEIKLVEIETPTSTSKIIKKILGNNNSQVLKKN